MRLLIAIFLLVAPAAALACEPCEKILDLRETARRADLVVVAKRTDYDAAEESRGDPFHQGPAVITLRVLRVLKGSPGMPLLRVRSWYGMCPYGILLKDETAVVFLAREGESYTAVNQGCAEKILTVIEGRVTVGGEVLSVEDFRDRFIGGE